MRFDSLHRQKRRTGALRNGRLGMQNARAGIPNRVAQGIRTGGGSWPHTGIVGATSGIAPGGTPASAIKPWLRSAVGERGKWSGRRRGAFSGTKPERNARRRAADGSPPLLRSCTMQARDERAVCEAERASSRGGQGRRTARAAKQTARWSRRIRSIWNLFKKTIQLISLPSHRNLKKRLEIS